MAYVDTSCVAALAFREPGAAELAAELDSFDRLVTSNLLEAELRAALQREGMTDRIDDYLHQVSWIYPTRPMTPEFVRLASAGYVRGADLWHVACALFVAPEGRDLVFASLDKQQRDLARRVGFDLLPA